MNRLNVVNKVVLILCLCTLQACGRYVVGEREQALKRLEHGRFGGKESAHLAENLMENRGRQAYGSPPDAGVCVNMFKMLGNTYPSTYDSGDTLLHFWRKLKKTCQRQVFFKCSSISKCDRRILYVRRSVCLGKASVVIDFILAFIFNSIHIYYSRLQQIINE